MEQHISPYAIPQIEVERAKNYLHESTAAMMAMDVEPRHLDRLAQMARSVVACMMTGGKLMIAGNGGSAGDAQHIAAEFVARLNYDRGPLPAMALTVDGSVLTAVSNDYSYDHVFERQVLAHGTSKDIFLAISTSGRSPSILRAVEAAHTLRIYCIAFTGEEENDLSGIADYTFYAPSKKTAIIQQCHMVAAHVLCALVERTMFPAMDIVMDEPASEAA